LLSASSCFVRLLSGVSEVRCLAVAFSSGWFGGVVLPRPVRAAGSGVARLFAVIVQGGRGVWGGGQSL
jgi:hypothetical protein